MPQLFSACRSILPLLLAVSTSASSAETRQLPVIPLTAGVYLIQAEVAATDAQREQGLMYRKSLADNGGMLFLFGAPAGVCMWMKNTLIPLSVAFIGVDGRVVNIEDMQPQTENSHCARKPIAYALEMNAGWFEHRHIKPGAVIGGLPPLK